MPADKRSVHTDALETLGTIIGEKEARDAIHLAVEPVVAGEKLAPGEHVKMVDGKAFGTPVGGGLGIVDPFLEAPVREGERFWFVIYPRMITSLRHVWSHPGFADTVDVPVPVAGSKEASMRWIEEYADSLSGEDYDDEYRTITANDLIEYGKTWVDSDWGDYLVKGGLLEGVGTDPAFWPHFTNVTGLTPRDPNASFFSCSC